MRRTALCLLAAVFIARLGTTRFAATIGVEECKAQLKEEKRKRVERAISECWARYAQERGALDAT